MRTGICIATYKRPDGLKRLLDSIAALPADQKDIFVFVAENDAQGQQGYEFCQQNKNTYPFTLECGVEARAGISHARNKSLMLAKDYGDKLDFISFMDDDTEVSPLWLQDMIWTMSFFDADVVVGKIEARFNDKTSEFLYSPFFNSFNVPPTGTPLDDGGTNNVLLKKIIFDKIGFEPFDPELSLAGGEDSDLFRRIKDDHKMVQCASAIIYETFPDSRLTEKWMLNRSYRSGSTYAYILKKYDGSMKYYSMVVRKILKYAVEFVSISLKPTFAKKYDYYNTKGFMHYVIKNRPFQEYARAANI